ncbi:aspartate carbamoyltransferase catalytic subunit [Jeotgalibacillus sp. S-D1]|uniref:aspartate carbamoyltransferase catalytic subunit n=1 Tax=Jeotgalibacillus sp. S-D1 TaxID=2552189 RepID=UPI0010598019|nr:aspartate carbamoyltransferase catalytic subunit [Jeotgalibacillus sp. S-D1]TDL35505.1 aspartate carbamoyltransferase catalytic subunit [Jeotgalibacillus sp. S-D1]
MDDLTNEQMMYLIETAEAFRRGQKQLTRPYYAANLFFEDSTRTKSSFEMAERKLGMNVISFDAQTASIQKGETLYDTVKTLEAVGLDVVVIRHGEDRFFDQLEGRVKLSIINGGDGMGHHPSQCLLDLQTIYQEFKSFKGLNVTIVGDIHHSRVARSNAIALKRLGAFVQFSGPKEWMDDDLLAIGRYIDFDQAVETSDVLMMLRVQHERHAFGMTFSKNEYHRLYGLNAEREKRMKQSSIIMHPAPVNRGVEIADELVECSRSRIFKQMANGVYTRMAMLQFVLQQREALKHEFVN